MPSSLILNGERLPIGTSDLNGDTSEEEEFGPPEPPQWPDAEWDAYQASLPDYYENSGEPWDQPSSEQRQPRARRELSMPATPSADGDPNAFALALAKVTHLSVTLFSLCVLACRPHRSQLNAHSRREVYRDHPAQRASLLAEPLTSGDESSAPSSKDLRCCSCSYGHLRPLS